MSASLVALALALPSVAHAARVPLVEGTCDLTGLGIDAPTGVVSDPVLGIGVLDGTDRRIRFMDDHCAPTGVSIQLGAFSQDPQGVGWSSTMGELAVVDATADELFFVSPGGAQLGSCDLATIGSASSSGVAWDPTTSRWVVMDAGGSTAWWIDPAAGEGGVWLTVDVLTRSEQGLLGLAFHPDFARNGRFYLHTSVSSKGEAVGRVAEWSSKPGAAPGDSAPTAGRTLVEVEQPYPNHDGGQIAFGADGKLYVAFGDGGAANDPHGNGQDRGTLLGAILRLEVEGADRVPKDNPFVGQDGVRPEIWAYGLRTPWRYSFAPDGRLVVADVGQNQT
ncbi:MAG: PQQ-dependent sugar dehydrogenase, partial [Myxococcales bacterium]|nr:PQQ-dependent sugar dehydrogenase [Myxococcales bacterium]